MDVALGTTDPLRRSWGRLLALGISLIVLGTVAISYAEIVTLASVVFFGALLAIGGVIEIAHAFRVRSTSGALLHVLAAVLSIVAGFLMMTEPLTGSLALTVLAAAYFLVSGAFRIAAALSVDLPHRGLAVFGGIVSLVLGLLVWSEMPGSALWLIGTFLGIDLLFRGWWAVTLALALRRGA
ncbi:MAG TPA: HdeD family acid-resistance protein [Myxococcota bacterium]|nr:HdeD family acid-resistance protein [Myxococcota bacterium]HTY19144.1 HdeD family acid-resistance protein [Myxococcota bacterium]